MSEREYSKMANQGRSGGQTIKFLIRERGLPEPPIGASPGELRVWKMQRGLLAPPGPASNPKAPAVHQRRR